MDPRHVSLCFLSTVMLSVAFARTVGPAPSNELTDSRSKPEVAGYLSDIRAFYKLYEECSATEFSPCLKKKVVLALDRMGRNSKHLSIIEGVEFVKDTSVQDSTQVSEEELETSLPRALEERDSALNQMIFDKIIDFFKTHTLEFKLFDESGRSLQEEGRRRNRFNSLMMFPLLFGGMLVPLAYGALALLAGKALIISKLALALAVIVGLKKLVGGGGGESYQVVQVPHHGGGHHYKRSLEDDSAQKLAYRAYITSDKLQGL